MTSGKSDCLLTDAFHQTPVACNDIGMVIDDLGTIAGALDLFGHGKADRIGDTLTQRACGDFDTCGVAVFRVACGDGAPLAEISDLIDRHIGVSGQMQ